MESISHAIATADRVKSFIHAEVRAKDNKITTDKEADEAQEAKDKVRSLDA